MAQPPYTAEEARIELERRRSTNGGYLTSGDIEDVVANTDVGSGDGKKTLLWSGNASIQEGDGIESRVTAEALADQSDEIRLIQDTEAATLLEPEPNDIVNGNALDLRQEYLDAINRERALEIPPKPPLEIDSMRLRRVGRGLPRHISLA